MTTTVTAAAGAGPSPGWGRLWRREIHHYPGAGRRIGYLSIVVLTTVLFYYQYYVISGVSDQVIAGTGASFMFFVNINVVSALASALSSVLGGDQRPHRTGQHRHPRSAGLRAGLSRGFPVRPW